MEIHFFDQSVDIKQCVLGSVVFEIVLTDKFNHELYRPAHITGFSYNYCGELVIAIKSAGQNSEERFIHPLSLSWDCLENS